MAGGLQGHFLTTLKTGGGMLKGHFLETTKQRVSGNYVANLFQAIQYIGVRWMGHSFEATASPTSHTLLALSQLSHFLNAQQTNSTM